MDLLGNLNPPQRDAVLHGDGPLLVFAGAGSGKTRVITHRLAFLVRERDVRPWQVLAVTFTNKAAGEMRARVGHLLGTGLRDTWIGTFHATCARLLRQFADEAGLKRDFVIFDDADQKSVVARCLRELNIDERRVAPRAVQSRIQQAKQECVAASEYEPGNYFEDQVAKVYRRYEEYMLSAGALDFGDLLFLMVRLLEQEEAVRTALQQRFRYVLVDEFQDTNYVQYRLLKLLAGEGRNLCVVGDDDQSIYRWRGADVRNILHFKQDYPETMVVLLEQNYRSSANILAGAMAVIKRNRTRAPKTLWTENPPGELIQMATLEDERAEAAWVVEAVTEKLGAGVSPGDIAVFYRINAQARVLEEALRAANIPYRVVGGMKFYERAEVKDLVGYLRVIHNPDDDVDLARIINRPPRKIGKTTVDRLLGLAGGERISLHEALRHVLADETWPAATRKRLQGFHDLLAGLRDLAAASGPADLAVAVLERTGYLDDLRAQDTPEADTRIENLAELVGSFQAFEQEADEPTLAALLESISLQQDTDNLDEKPQTVTLMTVHSAKGLEFPLVLLTGMEEGMFPYRRANEEIDMHEERERLEEERRLCYVAMTRARDRLTLTNVARRRLFGTERYNPPSRFLEDIPPEIVARVGVSVFAPPRPGAGSSGLDDWSPSPIAANRQARRFRQPAWAAEISLPGVTKRGATTGTKKSVDPDELEEIPDEPRVVLDAPDGGQDLDGMLRPGMRVRHVKYGIGRIERVDGGIPPKATVRFPDAGRKLILTRFLQPC